MVAAKILEPEAGLELSGSASHAPGWTYEEAFKRNRGLITVEAHEKLRNSRVAIAGMGGVGGIHLVTLARLGVGKFTIADPDTFSVANFNRQYGATVSNLDRNKAEAMAEIALDINPELDIRVFSKAVDSTNVDDFLNGANLYVDSLDFFAIDARRLVFRKAAEYGIWAVTAGPMGFSTAWLSFDPQGMSFDKYFDLTDSMERVDKLIAFAAGLTPQATHMTYMDLSKVSLKEQAGPSASLACHLASSVVGAAAVEILTTGSTSKPAPYYRQFDSLRGMLKMGSLKRGNASVKQRIKRRVMKRWFSHLFEQRD